jgi:hypothetical protein
MKPKRRVTKFNLSLPQKLQAAKKVLTRSAVEGVGVDVGAAGAVDATVKISPMVRLRQMATWKLVSSRGQMKVMRPVTMISLPLQR